MDCTDYTNYPANNGFMVISAKCSNNHEIWLTKSGTPGPRAAVRIVDWRIIARLNHGETFVSGPFCYDKSGKEVYLSAVFHWHGKQNIQRGDKVIVNAWTLDTRRGQFTRASRSFIKSIRCTISDDE